jgi:hypothetical protein
MAISITNLSGGNTPADGSDPRTFPAIWNATATDLEGVATDLDTLEATVGAHDLNSLSGVGITTPVEGDLLTYNGTSWVNGVPAGSILQVVSATKTDTFSTTSGSDVSITGLTATITPASTSSKILVSVSVPFSTSTNQINSITLTRGGTPIGGGTVAGSRTSAFRSAYTTSTNTGGMLSGEFLDSPSSTSATTYQVQAKTSAGTLSFNISGGDSDLADHPRTASTITLMEVAG